MLLFKKLLLVNTVFCLLLLLQACQPSFTVDQSEHYARKVGVINQFEITRWHNHVIARSNRISVISEVDDGVDMIVLSQVVADNLAPYFARVTGGYSKDSLVAAMELTKLQGSNFLLYVQIRDKSSLIDTKEPDSTTNYNRLSLTLMLVDLVSGDTIDKINMQVNTSHFKFWGNELQDLLAKPLAFVGESLTGQPNDN
jgi:hypothetical protein